MLFSSLQRWPQVALTSPMTICRTMPFHNPLLYNHAATAAAGHGQPREDCLPQTGTTCVSSKRLSLDRIHYTFLCLSFIQSLCLFTSFTLPSLSPSLFLFSYLPFSFTLFFRTWPLNCQWWRYQQTQWHHWSPMATSSTLEPRKKLDNSEIPPAHTHTNHLTLELLFLLSIMDIYSSLTSNTLCITQWHPLYPVIHDMSHHLCVKAI